MASIHKEVSDSNAPPPLRSGNATPRRRRHPHPSGSRVRRRPRSLEGGLQDSKIRKGGLGSRGAESSTSTSGNGGS